MTSRPSPSRLFVSIILSCVLLYSFILRKCHIQHARAIQYPILDPELLSMAGDDLNVWIQHDTSSPVVGPEKSYQLPDSDELSKIPNQLSVIQFSTSRGITFLNDFDHLRMLWFGCSLHRILAFLREHMIELETTFVLNVGDRWVQNPSFPVFSKGRVSTDSDKIGMNSTSERQLLDLMIPYEELLWNYQPILNTPFVKKTRKVVFRGGCTHPNRSTMTRTLQNSASLAFSADLKLSCEPNYTYLSPIQQSRFRCLLDYDGESYSRRTAWYLETGSVILRGGEIDDALSRLARRIQRNPATNNVNSSRDSHSPIVFWKTSELCSVAQRCLNDDVWSSETSRAATHFWTQYVKNGQEVWEGYLLHLLIEQSKRWRLIIPDSYNQHPKHGLFKILSSTLVCPLIHDASFPTGENGILRWRFILGAVFISLTTIVAFYTLILPSAHHLWISDGVLSARRCLSASLRQRLRLPLFFRRIKSEDSNKFSFPRTPSSPFAELNRLHRQGILSSFLKPSTRHDE